MKNLITDYPTVEIVTATKPLVTALLKMNTHNRTPKDREIADMSKDMAAGKFFLTGQGITVSKCGVLLDGQNRLMAMTKAGYPPIKFILMTGADLESQTAIDRGTKRSLADSLRLYMNITISTRMVALARALHEHQLTVRKDAVFGVTRQLSDSEVAIFLAQNSKLTTDVLAESGNVRTAVAAALYVYAYHESEKAFELCRQIHKGIGLDEDSPAYRLRTAIDRLKSSNTSRSRLDLARLTVSAICAHSQGRKVKLLKGSDSWATAAFKWSIPNVLEKP